MDVVAGAVVLDENMMPIYSAHVEVLVSSQYSLSHPCIQSTPNNSGTICGIGIREWQFHIRGVTEGRRLRCYAHEMISGLVHVIFGSTEQCICDMTVTNR